jgi:ParB family chromosome partitioning protein
MLRLRNLPEPIRQSIVERQISMGHARALLGAETSGQQTAAWRKTVARKLSVRETELLVKRLKAAPQKTAGPAGLRVGVLPIPGG